MSVDKLKILQENRRFEEEGWFSIIILGKWRSEVLTDIHQRHESSIHNEKQVMSKLQDRIDNLTSNLDTINSNYVSFHSRKRSLEFSPSQYAHKVFDLPRQDSSTPQLQSPERHPIKYDASRNMNSDLYFSSAENSERNRKDLHNKANWERIQKLEKDLLFTEQEIDKKISERKIENGEFKEIKLFQKKAKDKQRREPSKRVTFENSKSKIERKGSRSKLKNTKQNQLIRSSKEMKKDYPGEKRKFDNLESEMGKSFDKWNDLSQKRKVNEYI